MELFIEIIKHTIEITSIVFVMMLIIEYINVLTSGSWQESLAKSRWKQYVIASLLGATPGCLGAFMVVTMYTHRLVSFGALVTAMIATMGDESFVMLAMIPRETVMLSGTLIVTGILFGIITDSILKDKNMLHSQKCNGFESHTIEHCNCFPKGEILTQLRNCSLARGILSVLILFFIFYFITGDIGPKEWNWLRITILLSMGVALFIVLTVPDHFLEEHLWEHIATKHIPRIFLWTFGTLFAVHLLIDQLGLEKIRQESSWLIAGLAGLIGLIPESGPHLVFVTTYAKGLIPISILFVSAFVQDGHGMLPILAYSRRVFFIVKFIKLITGLLLGYILLFLGY